MASKCKIIIQHVRLTIYLFIIKNKTFTTVPWIQLFDTPSRTRSDILNHITYILSMDLHLFYRSTFTGPPIISFPGHFILYSEMQYYYSYYQNTTCHWVFMTTNYYDEILPQYREKRYNEFSKTGNSFEKSATQ